MKVLKVFTPASAAVLLIGKGPTRTSAASWDLAVPDDTLTERRDVAPASTNTALLAVAGIMCGRTSLNTHTTDSIWAEAIPTLRPPAVHMTHALVLAGNQEGGTIEIHRFFNELTTQFYALVLVDAQDGVIETPGTFLVFVEMRDRWDTPLKQVSAGSAVATRADQYYDDNNFTRSTKFVWEFPTPPPDRFMTRLVNMPLHLFNTLNAEHVNTILYSRRCRYSQPYRVNPNNTRNRRYRMFSRVTSDIAWILWDSWGARNRFQVVSPFCGGEETWEANEETKETPSCPAASPWLEMTAPTDAVLPPAFPAAVLTPSDVVMTTLPSLRKFSARVEKKASFPIAAAWPEMAAPSDAALFPAFPPTKLTERDTSSCPVASVSLEVAAPTDFALSPAFPAVVLTHFEAVVATLPSLSNSSPTVETDKSCRMEQRDALMLGIVVGTVGLYFKAGYYPQHVRCAQATPYTAGEIATSFDALDGHVSMFLTVHRFVCYQDSPSSLALLHKIGKTSFSELDGYAATSLSYLQIGYQATTSSKALQPAATWSHLQCSLLHAIGRQVVSIPFEPSVGPISLTMVPMTTTLSRISDAVMTTTAALITSPSAFNLQLPRATGREVATHAFGSFEASLEPMFPEVVPMTATLNRTSDSMTVITAALVDARTSSLLSQLLTADGRAVMIIPFEAFQDSIGPLFSTATPTITALNRTSGAVMMKTAASRNTSSIRLLRPQILAAIRLFHRSDSNRSLIMPKIGWNGTIQTGLYRCSADTGPMEQLDLRWAMMKSLEVHPHTGYAQGVRTQSRHYTAAAETPPSFNGLGRHDRHEPMSLGYLIETYPLTVSVFALSLYVCAVWLGGMFM